MIICSADVPRLIWVFIYSALSAAAQPGQGRLAQLAMQSGEYGKAALIMREMLKAQPENSGLRMNLAVALTKAGRPSAAIPELERVIREAPGTAPAWFLLGLAHQQLHEPLKAIAPLQQAVRLDPKNVDALLELADAELTSGDSRSAARDFGSLAAMDRRSAKAWEGLARAYLSSSETFASQLEKQSPDSPYRLALLARSRAAEGQAAKALSLYAAALGGSPDFPGIHSARAEIYRAAKRDDWAAVEGEKERQLKKPDCALKQTACAFLNSDWRRTLELSERSRSPEDLYWAALASARLASESLSQLSLFPQSAELHSVLADSYQRIGQRLEAVGEWRSALASKPGDGLMRGRLAESLFLSREYPESERILNGLVEEEPENSEWQFNLGNVLLQLDREEEALPHLLAATSLSPGLLTAQEALGRVYLKLDMPEQAVIHLTRALPLDNGSLSFALSSAYRKLGRVNDAKVALARYQALSKHEQAGEDKANTPLPGPLDHNL
jgi:tetratricopeptide (TPR) repeat protein